MKTTEKFFSEKVLHFCGKFARLRALEAKARP
jgi:hypothetical protein